MVVLTFPHGRADFVLMDSAVVTDTPADCQILFLKVDVLMSRSTYSKIDTGTRNKRISDFLALKQIYGVDFSEFFIGLLPDSEK